MIDGPPIIKFRNLYFVFLKRVKPQVQKKFLRDVDNKPSTRKDYRKAFKETYLYPSHGCRLKRRTPIFVAGQGFNILSFKYISSKVKMKKM